MGQGRRSSQIWKTFTADMARYVDPGLRPWSRLFLRKLVRAAYVHPGLFAVAVYRYGQWVQQECRVPLLKPLCQLAYYTGFNWVRTRLQIEVPRQARIGPGFRIDHFGGILVNSQIVAGRNLTLSQGILIGQADLGIPCLGDEITLSVGAKVIGGITLGNNVLVGTGAVVTHSFPDNAIIAGVPARLIRYRTLAGVPQEQP